MSVSLWKIQRELRRLGSQLLEPYRQIRDAFLRLDYRLRHAHHVKHFDGHVGLTERVAVFLIHQPRGVSESVLATCEHLQQQGYACVVVSNGHLTAEDLDRVLSRAAHVIVRPNFGYDFGGYQEGLVWLRQKKVNLNCLFLLNDSVWFPVLRDSTFLKDMECTGADIVGALSAQRGGAQRHQRKLFYASFMLLFSSKAWQSTKFQDFWKNYRQTSSKAATIRKGERKLSALFIHDEYFTHQVMVDSALYAKLALEITPSTWPSFGLELGLIDPVFDQQRRTLLEQTAPDTESQWRDWYARLGESQNMFTCAQGSLVLRAGVPFIKKSRDPHNMLVLRQSIDAFRACAAFNTTVAQEIQTQLDRHTYQ